MSVIKVIEVMASSPNSWEEAAQTAVSKASESVREIRSAYVKEQSAVVDNGKITEYRVTVKLSFSVQ